MEYSGLMNMRLLNQHMPKEGPNLHVSEFIYTMHEGLMLLNCVTNVTMKLNYPSNERNFSQITMGVHCIFQKQHYSPNILIPS